MLQDITQAPEDDNSTSEPFALTVDIGLRTYTTPAGKQLPIEHNVLLALALQEAAMDHVVGQEEAGVETTSTTAEELLEGWKQVAQKKIQDFQARYGPVKVSG